jgi:PAS domain S-box-containing protein
MHPLPAPDDAARLAALSQYQILDTSPDAMFDDLARLAAQVCTMPIAAINLIDAERQWFKARVGIDVAEVPRSLGCCPAVIGQPALVIVPDLAQDVRFAATPLVMAGTTLRFYAGMPLRTSEGHALGTLFVADVVPRQLSTAQADALRALARQVVALLDLHRLLVTRTEAADQALQASAARFRALVQHATDVVQVIGIDGITHYISPAAERILGYPPAKLIGQPIFDVIAVHPEDGDRLRALFADLLAHPSVSVTAEVRVQHGEGAWRTLEAVGQNLLADPSVGGIVVNYRDSTDRKQAEAWHAQQVRHAALREAVSTALHASDTVDQVLARCVEAVVRHVDAAFARVWTLNAAAQMLEL